MADKWLIAKNDESEKVLAQHGWTRDRRQGMFFATEFEAQAHIDRLRTTGHPARATAEDEGAMPGMPGAALTEYDPYGLVGKRH